MLARTMLLATALLLATSIANAQQPPQMTPSQVAIAITTSVNQLAQAVEQLARENEELKKKLEASGGTTNVPAMPTQPAK